MQDRRPQDPLLGTTPLKLRDEREHSVQQGPCSGSKFATEIASIKDQEKGSSKEDWAKTRDARPLWGGLRLDWGPQKLLPEF